MPYRVGDGSTGKEKEPAEKSEIVKASRSSLWRSGGGKGEAKKKGKIAKKFSLIRTSEGYAIRFTGRKEKTARRIPRQTAVRV